MNPIIVKSISKRYDQIVALNETSFEVNEGELFGLIGPDGAGKTSLIRILSSLILPDSGKASVLGFDVIDDYKELRKNIGYMPGRFSLYADLTVRENLEFFAGVFGTSVESNYYLIENIYHMLKPFENRLAGNLSGGMKQKLALSCALIHKPKVLFLDEPTTGVDAVSRIEFWAMLRTLKLENITILVSTPYMEEASQCDRIALINKGEFLRVDSPESIIESYPFKLFRVLGKNPYALLGLLKSLPSCNNAFLFGEEIHYSTTNPNDTELMIQEKILKDFNQNVQVEMIKPSIEDCFMNFMVDDQAEKY